MKENKNQEWIMPQDIQETETSDLKEMLDKYIARPVIKRWKEDFIDEDTKEITTIERSEMLLPAGLLIDQELLAKINFAMQCGDIKSVIVSDYNIKSQRSLYHSAYIVSLSDSVGKHDIYVSGCDSTDDAAQIVSDYLSVYGIPTISSNSFSIKETKVTDIHLLAKNDLSEEASNYLRDMTNISLNAKSNFMEDENIPLPKTMTTESGWLAKVTVWRADTFEKKWKKTNVALLVMADFFESALEYFNNYWSSNADKNTIWEFKSVSKCSIEFAIPLDYIKRWREKHDGE